MENFGSLDRTVDRLVFAPVKRPPRDEFDPEREARIRAITRRIRSDSRWRPRADRRGAA